MELSIIIVNYKTPLLLLKCLNSIYNTTPPNIRCETIVVDNNSNDNSEAIVKKEFKEITWIQKNENDGFGRANNLGIKHSKGTYILLLNSDVVVLPGTIEKCLKAIQQDKTIGVLGCRLLNKDGTIQKSIYDGNGSASDILKNNLLLDYFFKFSNREERVRAIMGSFMLIPKFVIDRVGQFDPDFFMYSEEIDLCRRIEKHNYKIFYYNEVSAIHVHGGSTINKERANKQRFLSNVLLQFKSDKPFNYLLYHLLFFFNMITNFFAMWFLDKSYRKEYRKGFFEEQKYYFSNIIYYLTIPILYNRKPGNGERLLRRGQ